MSFEVTIFICLFVSDNYNELIRSLQPKFRTYTLDKMKTEVTDGAYINEALKCSSLNISNPKEDEPHGGLKGSNEYICK